MIDDGSDRGMNRVAIVFMTKDRCELTRRAIEPLLKHADKFDLLVCDGSKTAEGEQLPNQYVNHGVKGVAWNVRGGADPAIAYALTWLLQYKKNYTHVGLCENDVLITDPDWFGKTMTLFEQGAQDGLKVGAVSTRCYEDRILIQRDGYAVCHNLGFGQQIMTREAAQIALKHFRTGWTNVNRLVFSQLSGLDIGAYWAFRGGQHVVTADWNFDTTLNAHGLASLALVPSPINMIGQVPPLAEQGLAIAAAPVEARRDNKAFEIYRDRLKAVREHKLHIAWPGLIHQDPSGYIVFPHQIEYLGGSCSGDWVLRWSQGLGPFAYRAGECNELPDKPFMQVPILGPCDILVSGGDVGGKVRVVDTMTGFEATPEIFPESEQHQVFALNVPSACGYREIQLTVLSPGVSFFGIRCREQQPLRTAIAFEYTRLPPCA